MPFLLLWSLPDAPLILVDAVNDLGIVIGDVQHFRGFVAGHAEVFDKKYQFESVLIGYCIILALVRIIVGRLRGDRRFLLVRLRTLWRGLILVRNLADGLFGLCRSLD